MTIQFNTGSNIEGSDRQSEYFSTLINNDLKRFESYITRMEVHLSDQDSSSKNGVDDIKCVLETRLKNMNPIAVTNNGSSHEEAIKGAIDKMKKSLDTVTGRLKTH